MMKLDWMKSFKPPQWCDKTYITYIYGFIINFRPTNPYVYEYLTLKTTEVEIWERIFPLFLHSADTQSIFVALLSDLLNYNVVIMTSALIGIFATITSIIWETSFFHIQFAEVLYGVVFATQLAYYVQIYEFTDIKSYQRATSYIRAAPLLGNAVSAFLAQYLIENNILSYHGLYYINLGSYSLAFTLSLFLPTRTSTEDSEDTNEAKLSRESLVEAYNFMKTNFLKSFKQKYVVKYSIWSSLTLSGFYQISLQIEPFLKMVFFYDTFATYQKNAAIIGISSTLAFFAVLISGIANLDWKFKGDLILSTISIVQAFALIFMSQCKILFFASMFYWIFVIFFYFSISIISAEISKNLDKGCFGLVFGLINFASLGFNCVVIYASNSFHSSYDLQIMICGYYHLIISVIFLAVGIGNWFVKHTYQ